MAVRKPLLALPCLMVLLLATLPLSIRATAAGGAADGSLTQFLEQRDDAQHPYRASRRLEAANGSRSGWIEATTSFSRQTGFQYEITAEGGSGYIRTKVLRALLDGERDVIARGETGRSALQPSNYAFEPNGVDAEGLANVLLSPRRHDHVLITGSMFLRPGDGELVRLQGRLAKNPSFWVKNVDIVRAYERIAGVVVPVALNSKAQLRMLGLATLRMTYDYSEIDGRPVQTQISRR